MRCEARAQAAWRRAAAAARRGARPPGGPGHLSPGLATPGLHAHLSRPACQHPPAGPQQRALQLRHQSPTHLPLLLVPLALLLELLLAPLALPLALLLAPLALLLLLLPLHRALQLALLLQLAVEGVALIDLLEAGGLHERAVLLLLAPRQLVRLVHRGPAGGGGGGGASGKRAAAAAGRQRRSRARRQGERTCS